MSGVYIGMIFFVIWQFRINNGFGGVIHFGDSLIFVAATLLPLPYSLFVAAIGPGLFNLMEIPIWFPFTIVIKPLMALCFTNKGDKILSSVRNWIAPFAAATINTVLYFGANMFLFDNWGSGVAALPGLLIQGIGSVIFFFVIAIALDLANTKKLLKR